jgi:hypothetical protein
MGWGWRRASTTVDLDRTGDGLTVAILGLLGCAVGFAVLTARRRRRVVLKKVVTLERISRLGVASIDPKDVLAREEDSVRWTAPGLSRFHRRDCPALLLASGTPHAVTASSGELDVCLLCHREA